MGIMPERFNSTSAPLVDKGLTTWGGGLRKEIATCATPGWRSLSPLSAGREANEDDMEV